MFLFSFLTFVNQAYAPTTTAAISCIRTLKKKKEEEESAFSIAIYDNKLRHNCCTTCETLDAVFLRRTSPERERGERSDAFWVERARSEAQNPVTRSPKEVDQCLHAREDLFCLPASPGLFLRNCD